MENGAHSKSDDKSSRHAVIFSSYIPDTSVAYAVGAYYIDLIKKYFADSDVYIGINTESSQKWRLMLLQSGLRIIICDVDPRLSIGSDVAGFQSILIFLRETGANHDFYWFGHTKGASHERYEDAEALRWVIERDFWSRRTEVEAHCNPARHGVFPALPMPSADINQPIRDYLRDIYPAPFAPIGFITTYTFFGMTGPALRAFLSNADRRFFENNLLDGTGLSRYFFEGGFAWVADMAGFEPFLLHKELPQGQVDEDPSSPSDPIEFEINQRKVFHMIARWKAEVDTIRGETDDTPSFPFRRHTAISSLRVLANASSHKISLRSQKFVLFDEQETSPGRAIPISAAAELENLYNALASHVAKVGPIGLYSIRNALLCGPAFIFKGDQLVDMPDLIPDYVRHDIDAGRQWDLKPDLPKRTVAGQSVVVVSNAYLIYGHWLVDIIPRIWLHVTFVENGKAATFIVPRGTPAYAIAIMQRFFGIKNIEMHEINNENLVLEEAIVPSLLHHSHLFHPTMNKFVEDMINHPLVSNTREKNMFHDRIYITRKSFRNNSNSYKRTLSNEDDVIGLMTSLGFAVIAPEEMSWEEQIATFHRAKVIVGESGSGLHNAIFSKSGSAVICLNPSNHLQGSIAALRDQFIIFQCSETDTNDDAVSYFVDINRLRTAVSAALDAQAHA